MTVRVFVSHSAKEKEAADVRAALVGELEKHFTVLMDQYTLRAGDAWRAQINLWLGACDVAIVLLSEAALESAYVLYELSVLSYRCTSSGGAFRILPIYIGKVDEEMLKKSRLDPMQLTEIQSLRGTAPEIVQGVLAELANCVEADERPIDRLVESIRDILAGVRQEVIARAAKKLALKVPWQTDADPIGPFALRLLSVGMEAAIPALIELRPSLKKDPEAMRALVELVAASWVDFKTVDELPALAKAPSGRAVALNADNFDLARMYNTAASGGKDTWRFLDATNITPEPEPGETYADAFARQVGDELRKQLKLKESENLQSTLAAFDKHNSVVVAMRWEGVDQEVLERLETVHPHVTFFFLTGPSAGELPVDERLLRLLVPPLQDGDEPEVLTQYGALDTNVMLPLR